MTSEYSNYPLSLEIGLPDIVIRYCAKCVYVCACVCFFFKRILTTITARVKLFDAYAQLFLI